MFLRPASLIAFALALFTLSSLRGDDVVTFRGGKEGKQTLRRNGTIDDYTGAGLIIRTSSGRQETIAADRILEIQTTSTAEELSGDNLRKEGKLEEAIQSYREAKRRESRKWVTRRIMASLVACYELRGQIDLAGDEFLAILASDPDTPYFAAIPLAWRTSTLDGATADHAKAWLAKANQPAAQLLAGSWLLAGAERARAIASLKALSSDLDPRIAHLASAQLWRTTLVTASPEEMVRWQAHVNRMPAELRSGPLLILGDGLARNEQPEDALLAYLQVTLVYPQRETLAGEGLLSAARTMEKLSRAEDAVRLYRELRNKYPSFAEKHGIEGRIKTLIATSSSSQTD